MCTELGWTCGLPATRTEHFAAASARAARVVDTHRGVVMEALNSGELASTAERSLSEVVQNLEYLATHLTAKVAEVRFFDGQSFGDLLKNWDEPANLNGQFADARSRLQLNLDNPDQICEFVPNLDLAASVIPMGTNEWRSRMGLPPGGFPLNTRYRGGGAMRGRDGRIYPIAISEVDVDGEVYNADDSKLPGERVTTLLGRDPGWNVLDHQSGIARFEEPLGGGPESIRRRRSRQRAEDPERCRR